MAKPADKIFSLLDQYTQAMPGPYQDMIIATFGGCSEIESGYWGRGASAPHV